MTSSSKNDATREQWRELGFYYELDRDLLQWRLIGSRTGLLRFRDLLIEYAENPEHANNSEQQAYGPRAQLQIATWPDPGIEADAISGSLDDLRNLAAIVERKLSGAQPGDRVRIGRDFAPASDYVLALDVRQEGFDPSAPDRSLRDVD